MCWGKNKKWQNAGNTQVKCHYFKKYNIWVNVVCCCPTLGFIHELRLLFISQILIIPFSLVTGIHTLLSFNFYHSESTCLDKLITHAVFFLKEKKKDKILCSKGLEGKFRCFKMLFCWSCVYEISTTEVVSANSAWPIVRVATFIRVRRLKNTRIFL